MKMHRYILTMTMLCSAFLAGACGDTVNNYYGSEDEPSNGGGTTNPPVTDKTENTQARCSDGIDNDDNGKADCEDPNCASFTFCNKSEEGKENTLSACLDGEDNDGDGNIDCDDSECKQFTICQEKVDENTEATCKDGLDNDGDGNIDCDDSECKAFSMCQPSTEHKTPENTLAACTDEIDNDGDGKLDCDDSECKFFSICQESTDTKNTENTYAACTDKVDNDGDGLTDCDDPDCKEFAVCQSADVPETPKEDTESACTDGIDNDGDGDLDCLDTDCQVFDICKSAVGVKENTRELCSDGLDNDFNGVADAQDPNCARFVNGGGAYGETYDSCKNKSDVDGDGKKGCDDPECSIYDVCMKDYSATKDECPDDPFKFKKDSCACGETSVDGVCYTNIASATEFFSKITSKPSGKFIIKQPIDFGETNHAPIAGFSGVLDGGGQRITGVLNQDASEDTEPACGLFGRLTTNPEVTFKNIDLAITLNCTGAPGKSLAVGGLAASLNGNANHIVGSSKVHVEIFDTTTVYLTIASDRYIGGLFGNTNFDKSNISDIKLKGNVSAYYNTYIAVSDDSDKSNTVLRDRVGGLVGAGKVLRNIDADVNVTLDSRNGNAGTYIRTFVGGVAGRASLLDQVHSRGYIKQVGNETTTKYVDWAFTAGVAGYINDGASNVSFNGTIEVSGYPVSNIREQKKYTPKTGYANYYDAWIGYGKDYASNKEDDYSHPKNYGNHIGGIAAVLGSAVKSDFSASEYDEKTKIFKAGIEQAVVDADFYVTANNASVGGILGSMLNNNTFVRNSSANIGMTFLRNPDTSYQRKCYYGGIVGLTIGQWNLNPVSYVINNSARTRHYANQGTLNNTEKFNIGGITGGPYGVLVNNFASDTIYCGESCAYSLTAINGAYVYESYWNKDVAGTTSGADYSDASAQPYTYNASGVPVTRAQDSVLGLLRYNAGYDGGVLSAHIPANADGKYTDWTTTTDADGHSIPVPMIK